jgi:hypothetical protein
MKIVKRALSSVQYPEGCNSTVELFTGNKVRELKNLGTPAI